MKEGNIRFIPSCSYIIPKQYYKFMNIMIENKISMENIEKLKDNIKDV